MSEVIACGLLKACVSELTLYIPNVLTEIVINYWTLQDRITTYYLSSQVPSTPDPWINVLEQRYYGISVNLRNTVGTLMRDHNNSLTYDYACRQATLAIMFEYNYSSTLSEDIVALLILIGYYVQSPSLAPIQSNFVFMLYAWYHQDHGRLLTTCLRGLVKKDLYASIAYLLGYTQPDLKWIRKLSEYYPNENHDDYTLILRQLAPIKVSVDQLNKFTDNKSTVYHGLHFRTPRLAQPFSHLPGLIPVDDYQRTAKLD